MLENAVQLFGMPILLMSQNMAPAFFAIVEDFRTEGTDFVRAVMNLMDTFLKLFLVPLILWLRLVDFMLS